MQEKITRRTFLLGVGGAAALASFGIPAMAQTSQRRILHIITDDQPQYLMDPMPVTCRQIRDAGSNFTSGHVDVPLCGPARVSLLTGLSITTHKCDTNRTWREFEASPLSLGERTVARYMKDAGYATGHFGKYINEHWGASVPSYWDRWCETWNDEFAAPQVNTDGAFTEVPPGAPSKWSAQMCAEFIRSQSGPWFAQYCPTIPHNPYTPSSDSVHRYDGARRNVPSVNEQDMSDKPQWMRSLPPAAAAKVQAEFEGKKEELADLDRLGISPILEALASTGQLANTVIFFTSDNGYMHGEHRLRYKDKPYWESAEVPFFVKGPGVRRSARVALVNHTDLMVTTCEIAGISPATLDVDGRSMLANLNRGTFTGWRKRMLVTGSDAVGPEENPGGSNDSSGGWWLLREGPKAFIMRENGAKELYWMDSDHHQMNNKAWSAVSTIRTRLTETVEAMRVASGEERRRLEEL